MILVIDNRDSFVFNLVRYLQELDRDVSVVNSDALSLSEVDAMAPEAILLSPGPGSPQDAGCSMNIVREFTGKIPILGVCLGHQVIAAAHGWSVKRAILPRHGQGVLLDHSGDGVFAGLPNPFRVGLYHSLIVVPNGNPGFSIDARSPAGEIMAISRPSDRLYGVQFHPESVLTEHGHHLLSNFLSLAGKDVA